EDRLDRRAGNEVAGVWASPADETQHRRDDEVGGEDERHQQPRGPRQRPVEAQDEARRLLARHRLGDDLAEHAHDRGDHRRGDQPRPAAYTGIKTTVAMDEATMCEIVTPTMAVDR